jgi:hypothetical protein
MPSVKRIVCLANSRKLSGRCIAGKLMVAPNVGTWLRPISARASEEISEYERQYKDGSDPKVLDIIDVPLVQPRPKPPQLENWLIEPEEYWVKSGQMGWRDLVKLVDVPGPLWLDGHSTKRGLNDEIPLAEAQQAISSLRLITVSTVTLSVALHGAGFENAKRRVQGRFVHEGTKYWLWVTDPVYERAYLARPDGLYQLDECCLTISIGEPFGQSCYKLIAAIIEKSGGIRV